ncbi:MAG: 50S ribosomal protein L23 [Patescibacteria group bacterium]
MALFDFLKRKNEIQKSKEKQPEKVSVAGDTKTVQETRAARAKKDVRGFSYEVVKEPHISEKSTNLGQDNKYVFKVYNNTNKPEIKKAVEGIYRVDVLDVNIIKIPKKKRRIGRTEGFRKRYTKAVVTIKEGQKIEIY